MEDNGSMERTEQQLHDGEWTGSGEGRSGSIIAKVTVKNHEVESVTIVSQSESVFAQDARVETGWPTSWSMAASLV